MISSLRKSILLKCVHSTWIPHSQSTIRFEFTIITYHYGITGIIFFTEGVLYQNCIITLHKAMITLNTYVTYSQDYT